jgi:uncharacterized protein involved in exopolysaccharide biosynthesis
VTDRPEQRARRNSKPVAAVERFLASHKAIVAALALVLTGATAATVLSEYASKDDVRSLRARDEQIERQIAEMRETHVEIRSALTAVRDAAKSTREDIKSLLQHVLAHPPQKGQ